MSYYRIVIPVTILLLLSAVVFLTKSAEGAEKVPILKQMKTGPGPGFSKPISYWGLDKDDGSIGNQAFTQFPRHIVVYTVEEIDKKLGAVTTATENLVNSNTKALRKDISDTKSDLLKAVSDVGKEGLVKSQRERLRAELLEELRKELEAELREKLRREIQSELVSDQKFLDQIAARLLHQKSKPSDEP